MPFAAVTVIGNEPAVVGVPESAPAALIVMPPATVAGLIVNVGAGEPVIPVNAKLYAWPTVPEFGVPVKFGATPAAAICSVSCFTAFGATPFAAVTVIGNEPAVVGVPASAPAALIVMPPATVAGLIVNVGAGEPVIPVNAKLYAAFCVPAPGVPVKPGATPAAAIWSVSCFTASGAVPFAAVTVIGNEPAVVGVPESTPAALIVMPPATACGVIVNVGAGEPVIPVNAKLYAAFCVPAVGVPVKPGGVDTCPAGSVIVRNAWSDVLALLFDETRNWQLVKSGSPLPGEAWPGARQLKRPCGLMPRNGWKPKFGSAAGKVTTPFASASTDAGDAPRSQFVVGSQPTAVGGVPSHCSMKTLPPAV